MAKGDSISNAIKVHSISEEYEYLDQHYGNYNLREQALIEKNGKYYDRMEIELSDGNLKVVFFDISSFYG